MSKTSELCARNDHYILPKNHPFAKENYSLLVAARVADKPITVAFSDDATNKCFENFPRVFHMRF